MASFLLSSLLFQTKGIKYKVSYILGAHVFNICSPALVINVTGSVALECNSGADTAAVVSLSIVRGFFVFDVNRIIATF